jgi:hypothetical protein
MIVMMRGSRFVCTPWPFTAQTVRALAGEDLKLAVTVPRHDAPKPAAVDHATMLAPTVDSVAA